MLLNDCRKHHKRKNEVKIPVDLNALMYWGATILSGFYQAMNDSVKAYKCENILNQWRDAATAVMWHDEVGSWLDFYMINNIKKD